MVRAALLLLALERLAPSERLLLGLPHADILESLVYAVSGTLPLFAVFGGTGAVPIPDAPRRSPILGAGQHFVERHPDRGPEPTPALLVPLKAPRNRPSLSVVIPTLNEERHIGSLLSDVMEQTKKADEVIVADAGSGDGTVSVVRRSPNVVLLNGSPPVAKGRNLGGRRARGDVLIFLDADVRLEEDFFEGFLEEFERRRLDVACPLYVPYRSTPTIRSVFTFFNLLFKSFEKLLPSGAGHCIAVRRKVFQESRGFDPDLKFDDIELIRRLSKVRRFVIVAQQVYVSDRRYRKHGVPQMFLTYLLMALFFALGKHRWANHLTYEFGRHEP
jgi:glycosyltransferase involved in cell wall biosynthesis